MSASPPYEQLIAEIGADLSGLEKGLRDAKRKIDDFGKNTKLDGVGKGFDSVGDKLRSMGDHIGSVGQKLSIGVTVPLTLLAKKIFDVGAQYEQAMNVFQAATGATADEMSRAGVIAEKLGADMTLPATSAGDAAMAMTELAKGGFTASQAMDAAKGTLQLAAAATIDEARAAEIAANAINAFGLSAADSAKVADLLAASANASSAEITDVALSMQQSSASAAALKIPIDDLVTAIGSMANAGIKGSDAGTSMKTMFAALTPKTEAAAQALKDLNIDAFNAQGQFVGLKAIIEQAQPALARMTDEQKAYAIETAFGSDAMRAANILLGQGIEKWDAMHAAVNRTGAAQELAAAKTKGLSGTIGGLLSQLETVGLQIFKSVAPGLERLTKAAADAVGAFNNLSPAVRDFGVQAGVVAAASGPIAILISKLLSLGVGGAVAAGVIGGAVAMAAAYKTNFGQMGDAVDRFAKIFKSNADDTTSALDILINTIDLFGVGAVAVFDDLISSLDLTLRSLVTFANVASKAMILDFGGAIAAFREGSADIDAQTQDWSKRRAKQNEEINAIIEGGWRKHMAVLGIISSQGGGQAADSLVKAVQQGIPPLQVIFGQAGSASASSLTQSFSSTYRKSNPINIIKGEIEAAKPSLLQQMLGLGSSMGAAQKSGYMSATHHSPFFMIHEISNALAAISGMGSLAFAGGSKLGEAASAGFKKKAKGKELAKAFLDDFEAGFAGLTSAVSVILPKIEGGGLDALFNKMTSGAKKASEQTKNALKVVTDSVNDYLQSLGVGAKATEEELARMDKASSISLIKQSQSWAGLNDAIRKLQISDAAKGFSVVDGELKRVNNTVEISIGAYLRFGAAAKKAALEAGLSFKPVFPAIERDLISLEAQLKVDEKAFASVVDVIELAKDKFGELSEQGIKRVNRDIPGLMASLEKLKESLENNVILSAARIESEAVSSISRTIGEFEDMANRMKLTGSEFAKFVINKTADSLNTALDAIRAKSPEFANQFASLANDALKEWTDGLNPLPGALDSVVNKILDITVGLNFKLREQFKGAAAGVVEVFSALPGSVGKKLNDVINTVTSFANRVDTLLRGLHKIFAQVPDGLSGLVESISGIFKKSASELPVYTQGINNALDAVGVKFGPSMDKTMGQAAGAVSSGAARIIGSLSGLAGAFLAFSGAQGGGVAGGAISGALGAVSALGGIAAIFKASLAPLLAGPIGIAAIAGGAIVGALLGRKSQAQKEAEARQAEQQRLAIEKAKQDLQKGAQEVVQAALQTFRQAAETLEKLADYTKVPKGVFKAFFADLNRLLSEFVKMAKHFSGTMYDEAKKFAEAMGPGVELIAKAPAALEGIGRYLGVTQSSIAHFFSDFGRIVDSIGVLAEATANKAEKAIKKFATRVGPAVELLSSVSEGIASAFNLKPLTDEHLTAWGGSLNKMIAKLIDLSDDFDKFYIKQLALFSERVGTGMAFVSGSVEAVKAVMDFTGTLSTSQLNAFIDSFKTLIGGMIRLSEELATDGLAKAVAVADASLNISAAIKAAAEAFIALRDYVGFKDAAAKLFDDFKEVLRYLTMLEAMAFQYQDIGLRMEEALLKAAAAMTRGAEAFGKALGLTQSVLTGGLSMPKFPTGGGGFGGGDGESALSFGGGRSSLALAPVGGYSPPAGEVHHHHGDTFQFGDILVPEDSEAGKQLRKIMEQFGMIPRKSVARG